MLCPICGSTNENSAKFCSSCGGVLAQPTVKPASRTDMSISNDDTEFYKAAIGPKNQNYYLRYFSRTDGGKKIGVSWHWPAFFATFYWLLYRKMWLNALIYFFLPYIFLILLGVTSRVAGSSGYAVVGIGYAVYLIGILLLPPMYANALYYRHCKKKISEVKVSSRDIQRQLGELSGKGGTSHVALIIILVFGVVGVIGILAAIAIPAYQDYTTRARLTEAAAIGRNAAESVANYYYQYQQVPQSLEQAGFTAPLPPSVKAINVNNQNGIVIITMASGPVSGKSLLFVPSLEANNQITWKCVSQEIQDKHLPPHCRQKK